jgi:hypothetical protein
MILEVTGQVGARGKTEPPKTDKALAWQRIGSPGCAVWDERFGSSSVHCKSVPAGSTSARASLLTAHCRKR